MHAFLIIASSVVAISASVPYQLAIASGRVKPRIATWAVWGLLAAVAGSAALTSHQLPAAIYSLSTCGQCLIIMALGLRMGDRRIERLDIACFGMAILGAGSLLILKSPASAIIIAIVTDMIGTIPTFKHCWQRPFEESIYTYGLFVLSEWMILFTLNFKTFAAFAYPVFLLVEDGTLTLIVLFSPNGKRALRFVQQTRNHT